LSDACYELFDANIEGAHAYSRKILIDIAIARFNTNQTFFFLLLDIRKNYRIMNGLFKQALNAKLKPARLKHHVSIEEKKHVLRDAVRLLKETANDNLKIKQKVLALVKKLAFGKALYSIILGRLSDRLFENIEDLCLVIENALEEEGEYVTAEELLRSLS